MGHPVPLRRRVLVYRHSQAERGRTGQNESSKRISCGAGGGRGKGAVASAMVTCARLGLRVSGWRRAGAPGIGTATRQNTNCPRAASHATLRSTAIPSGEGTDVPWLNAKAWPTSHIERTPTASLGGHQNHSRCLWRSGSTSRFQPAKRQWKTSLNSHARCLKVLETRRTKENVWVATGLAVARS